MFVNEMDGCCEATEVCLLGEGKKQTKSTISNPERDEASEGSKLP